MPDVAAPALPPLPMAGADEHARLAWYAAVARWAPSKHNSQPWRFVVREHCLDVWADPARTLIRTDPHRRELVLACGAAVHLACVAARGAGREPAVELLPDGSGARLARLTERGPWPTCSHDRALLAAVPRRRTDRGPLDSRALDPGLSFRLQDAARSEGAILRLVITPGDRTSLADLVARADRLLARDRGADEELAPWLREPGDDRLDGVPTDHTRGAAASYRAEFVQRDFSSAHSRPAQDRAGPDHPLVGVLCSPGDTVTDRVRAGRALAAVLLEANVAGANASYLDQPVEEPAIRHQLRQQLDLAGMPQLILRIGAGATVAPTPRRVVDDVTLGC